MRFDGTAEVSIKEEPRELILLIEADLKLTVNSDRGHPLTKMLSAKLDGVTFIGVYTHEALAPLIVLEELFWL